MPFLAFKRNTEFNHGEVECFRSLNGFLFALAFRFPHLPGAHLVRHIVPDPIHVLLCQILIYFRIFLRVDRHAADIVHQLLTGDGVLIDKRGMPL